MRDLASALAINPRGHGRANRKHGEKEKEMANSPRTNRRQEWNKVGGWLSGAIAMAVLGFCRTGLVARARGSHGWS